MKKIDKAIEILQDIKAGKILEYYNTTVYEWQECTNRFAIENLINYEYRIKPDPIYRPYNNAEEFLKDSKIHGGWIKNKNTPYYFNPYHCCDLGVSVSNIKIPDITCYKDLFSQFVWYDDNTPCGILTD